MANYMNFSKKKQSKQSHSTRDLSSPDSHSIARQLPIANPKEWEKQIWYWRSHIDVLIQDYLSTEEKPIKLFPFQQVIVRAVGNCKIIDDVESRSLGKTYKMALILIALSILYPENQILVVSKTVRQALLVIKYIDMLASGNNNISREIQFPIKISKDAASIKFKNGTIIEALAMNVDGSNIRGLRKKIIYIDESAWVKTEVVQSVLFPILQYKRNIYWRYNDKGFEDFDSKLIQTTSAYLKSCDYFQRLKNTLRDIKNGDSTKFACALNYKTGVKYGIIDQQFVESQKLQMPLTSWEMEWNAKFIGETENSYFPYDLTEPCRKLTKVELFQAKGSKSRYILCCDIATSAATYADNAVICVIKISELANGTFNKYLVYIRSYHGHQLESLAYEIRKTCVRFPNIEKVIIDINAIGEGIVSILNAPFVDENNKEYQPFILDTFDKTAGNAIPIIRGVKADIKFNQRMATATRMYLENKTLHLPVLSTSMRRELELSDKDADKDKPILMEELAIYIETDALQYEMGNIVPKITVSGNVTYDTLGTTLHKDRYTSLGMGLEYIFSLEDTNRDQSRNNVDFCIGGSYNW
jgi:hypothetical protein